MNVNWKLWMQDWLQTGLYALAPTSWLIQNISTRLAEWYRTQPDQVWLYKSGRAALTGLLRGLRIEETNRDKVWIPDYICNVVELACRQAGYQVETYPVTNRWQPDWDKLTEILKKNDGGVVVVCSLFGSCPMTDRRAKELMDLFPSFEWIADECQQLATLPPVLPRPRLHVVISFNDKTCPGIMGGGVIGSGQECQAPAYAIPSLGKQMLTLAGLWRHGFRVAVQGVWRGKRSKRPSENDPDFSSARSPHYDCVPEPMYRLSLARAWVCIQHLREYENTRMAAWNNLRRLLSASGAADSLGEVIPPFWVPEIQAGGIRPEAPVPVQWKAPYGYAPGKSLLPQAYAIRLNHPYLWGSGS